MLVATNCAVSSWASLNEVMTMHSQHWELSEHVNACWSSLKENRLHHSWNVWCTWCANQLMTRLFECMKTVPALSYIWCLVQESFPPSHSTQMHHWCGSGLHEELLGYIHSQPQLLATLAACWPAPKSVWGQPFVEGEHRLHILMVCLWMIYAWVSEYRWHDGDELLLNNPNLTCCSNETI